MEASGSGEYVPHSVAYQKAVILMLIAVKITNLMAAVIFHIAFHKSHVRCLQIFATNVISPFILWVVFQMGMTVL
jgi:hypothetical protein